MSTGHFKIKGTQNLLYSVCTRYVWCSVRLLANTLLFALSIEIWAIFLIFLLIWFLDILRILIDSLHCLFTLMFLFVNSCFVSYSYAKFFIFSLTFDRRCLVFNRCVWVCVFVHLKGKSNKDSKDEY